MNIDELVTHYLAFRRTLGEKCNTNASILQAFCQAIGTTTAMAGIGAEVVVAFLSGSGLVTSGWFNKYQALKGFFRFAISRGHLTEAPLPKVLPKPPPPFVPYIYTRDEIRRLLDAIPSSQDYRTLIELDTLRAILLLLYGAGLRVGEALNLSIADADLPNALLTIRDTKFFKSRLVPIGQPLVGVLTELPKACVRPVSPGVDPLTTWRRRNKLRRLTISKREDGEGRADVLCTDYAFADGCGRPGTIGSVYSETPRIQGHAGRAKSFVDCSGRAW